MKNLLFSIYDCKSNLWAEPIMAVNEVSIKRYIYTKYNQNRLFGKDLFLYIVGEFDIEGYCLTEDDLEKNHNKIFLGYSAGDLDCPLKCRALHLIGTVKDIIDEIGKELEEGSVEPEEVD